MTPTPQPDRRVLKDRRKQPTSPFSFASLFGRRRTVRRAEDRERYVFVDRYSLRATATVLIAVVLSVADAIFTLKLVSRGARELNPVMDFFLRQGALPFLSVKYALTAGCLLWCLVNKNRRVFWEQVRVRSIILTVLLLYGLLVLYELLLDLKIGNL